MSDTKKYMNDSKTGKERVLGLLLLIHQRGFSFFFWDFFLKVYFACRNNSTGKTFVFLFSSQLLIGFLFFEIGCVDLEAGLHCGFGYVKRKTGSSSSS